MITNKNSHNLVKKELEINIPPDLNKSLMNHPKAKVQWVSLTQLARRDFITWIEGAKQSETRARRIAKTCAILPTGKRRPCCYSIMPANFYKALRASPKAKAQWSKLTSNERRDLIDWIDSAEKKEEHKFRIEKVSQVLATGKKNLSFFKK